MAYYFCLRGFCVFYLSVSRMPFAALVSGHDAPVFFVSLLGLGVRACAPFFFAIFQTRRLRCMLRCSVSFPQGSALQCTSAT